MWETGPCCLPSRFIKSGWLEHTWFSSRIFLAINLHLFFLKGMFHCHVDYQRLFSLKSMGSHDLTDLLCRKDDDRKLGHHVSLAMTWRRVDLAIKSPQEGSMSKSWTPGKYTYGRDTIHKYPQHLYYTYTILETRFYGSILSGGCYTEILVPCLLIKYMKWLHWSNGCQR